MIGTMNSDSVTVFVIEAHPMMREALCTAIADEVDMKVGMQADNVTQALQMAMIVVPDIILLALDNSDQGDIDGLIALRQFLPSTPILALTSNEEAGQEQVTLENGAQAVLTKAAPRADLLSALRELSRKAIIDHSEIHLGQEAGEKISH